MKCSRCGRYNSDRDSYCTACGAPLDPGAGPESSSGPRPVPVTVDRTATAVHIQKPDEPASDFLCFHCGKPFGPSELNCTKCGYPLSMARTSVRKKKTSRALVAVLVILVLLAAGGAGSFALYRAVRYSRAVEAYDGGDYLAARDAFEDLGGYRDSASRLKECNRALDYLAAAELYDQGRYEEALSAFEKLAGYMDSDGYIEKCTVWIRYNSAGDLYARGEFEEAYYLYLSLSGFEDSDERAAACIQPEPDEGLLEKGEAYTTDGTNLTVRNMTAKPVFLTIHLEDGSFWGSLWAPTAKSTTVRFAAGRYRMTWYWGTLWFGTKDRFGPDEMSGAVNDGAGEVIAIVSHTEIAF